MSDEPAARIEAAMLAAAFPSKRHDAAQRASTEVIRNLDVSYWRGHSVAEVEGETVLIPVRLHFTTSGLPLLETDDAWLLTRALETRSTDGYLRQRALRDLLQCPQPWTAPFIVLLVGGYVIEILDNVLEALTPELEQSLAQFIVHNKPLWETTKRQIISYWNAYYRRRWVGEVMPVFPRDDYVGFKVLDRLQAAAFR